MSVPEDKKLAQQDTSAYRGDQQMQRREFIDMSVCLLASASLPSLIFAQGKGRTMLLDNAKVAPFNSTLMGMIRGVADYYKIALSDAMVYGGSGHAFMINIHETLCPSGPYCWNRKPFYKILPNIGIAIKDEGFFSNTNTPDERAKIEAILKQALNDKQPCGLVNLEYQLISGYDETGFVASQPWAPKNDFPPKHLSFSSWAELGNGIHINFFTFKKVAALPETAIIVDSLKYAQDVYAHPASHTSSPYFTGSEAYSAWVRAIEAGHGAEHGNWWNATVWGECRSQASSYFAEIAKRHPHVADLANSLCADYKSISDKLIRVSEKELAADKKIALLKEAKETEQACIGRLDAVVRKV
jgi:hypothetical protein